MQHSKTHILLHTVQPVLVVIVIICGEHTVFQFLGLAMVILLYNYLSEMQGIEFPPL
jgi:hypothetical protein